MLQIVFAWTTAGRNSRRFWWKRSLSSRFSVIAGITNVEQRLMGASLLVFSNKTDIEGCMDVDEIQKVVGIASQAARFLTLPGATIGLYQDPQLDNYPLQCNYWSKVAGRLGMGCRRCEEETLLVLNNSLQNVGTLLMCNV